MTSGIDAIPRTNTPTTSTRTMTPRIASNPRRRQIFPDEEPEADVLEQRQEVPHREDDR